MHFGCDQCSNICTESMSRSTVDRLLQLIACSPCIETVDITGGAPEMHPDFRRMVSTIRSTGRKVIDRCNLTILLANGFTDVPQFLADHQCLPQR